MKNREKYRKTIMELSRNMDAGNLCRFRKRYVLPKLYEDIDQGSCKNVNCEWCRLLLYIWLDEEYEGYEEPPKPEVDWSKVPVDTLVRVKDDEEDTWALRYFCEWDGDTDMKYRTFPHGTTSKTTTYYYIENWKYCELVEDDDCE